MDRGDPASTYLYLCARRARTRDCDWRVWRLTALAAARSAPSSVRPVCGQIKKMK